MVQNYEFRDLLQSMLTWIFGFVLFVCLISFVILSIPVYLFRFLLIHRPKSWRSDLDEILDVTSSVFVNDYFSGKAPRSNVVVNIYIQGHVTTEDVRDIVLTQWINARNLETGELVFERFQQYPVRWLGFTFWKNGNENFSVETHIHKLFGPETCVTDTEIDTERERLLNQPFPKGQSPWSFHVIENYKNPNSLNKNENCSVIMFTVHHCISDGFGLMTAFIGGGMPGTSLNNVKVVQVNKVGERSFWQNICKGVIFSIKLLTDVVTFLPHQFRGAHWLIPDRIKMWHQVVARTEPILLHDFTAIRNKFGGSFTSILLSAVSAATYKTIAKDKKEIPVKSIKCLSTLQASGAYKIKSLSNQVTGILFDVPTTKMLGPVHRLRKVKEMVDKSKESTMPLATQFFAEIFGSHFYPICEVIAVNKSVSIGLSNIPVPMPFKYKGKPVIRVETLAGGLQGETGVTIIAQSYGNEVRFTICAEEGLMSREEVTQFSNYFTQEIHSLRDLTQNGNLLK